MKSPTSIATSAPSWQSTCASAATATVYAVDRIAQRIGPHGDGAELGAGRGEILVVPFELPGPSVEDFIRRALQRISIRLVAQLFRGQVLAVTEPNSLEE